MFLYSGPDLGVETVAVCCITNSAFCFENTCVFYVFIRIVMRFVAFLHKGAKGRVESMHIN